MQLQAQDCPQTSEAGGAKEGFSPLGFKGEHNPADSLISDFLASRTMRHEFLLFEAIQLVVLSYGSPKLLMANICGMLTICQEPY